MNGKGRAQEAGWGLGHAASMGSRKGCASEPRRAAWPGRKSHSFSCNLAVIAPNVRTTVLVSHLYFVTHFAHYPQYLVTASFFKTCAFTYLLQCERGVLIPFWE